MRKLNNIAKINVNGITLIALVITIIVLIILAGVTISLIIGERGIIKQAKEASKNYVDAAEYEKISLEQFKNQVDNMIINNEFIQETEDIDKIGDNAFDNDENSYEIIMNGTKRIYILEEQLGQEIVMKIETKYGRDENSTSIYFYDAEGEKIEGIGTYFYKIGGTTTTDIYTYTIPENCSYIEFWAGDGNYEPYIYLYSIQIAVSADINVELKEPIIKENIVEEGYYIVNLIPKMYTEKILYKINDGEWKEYKESLKIAEDGILYAKGIDKNGNESIKVNSIELNLITKEAFDNDTNTYYEVSTDKTQKLYIDSSVYGKNISINLKTRYGRDENSTSIYFYDTEGEKIEGIGTYFYKKGGTTTTNIYTYTIPENCSYIEFWTGDGTYGPYMYLYEITIE